jgi:hypothetical protein
VFVDFFVEDAFAASFIHFGVALVLRDIRLQAVVETGFARFLGVEGAVSIEVCTLDG